MFNYYEKRFRIRFLYFLTILLLVMFMLTIFLSFKLLSIEHCNCVRHEPMQHTLISSKSVMYNTKHKLAVLVPFRDRFEELLVFAPYIHKFLNEQQINHHIFILNQVDRYRFNRASLINIGYLFTKSEYDYIAMHDVDLLPLNKNLSYMYPNDHPFHIAAPNLHPRYNYNNFVGGILLVNREHFNLVDGMSNKYWGWGLEDDEFFVRLKGANLTIKRPTNISTGKKDTFKHIHDKQHRKRDTAKCYNQREVTRKRDRETGLHNVDYEILNVKELIIEGAPLSVVNVKLLCDHKITPWCNCTDVKK